MKGLIEILTANTEQNRARKGKSVFKEIASQLGGYTEALKYVGISRGLIDKMGRGQIKPKTEMKIKVAKWKMDNVKT